MKILHLVLKGKWYDMILSDIKKEEYREIKPFWIKRLCEDWLLTDVARLVSVMVVMNAEKEVNGAYSFKSYSHVCFHRGYTSESMIIEIKDISIGIGNKDLGCSKRRGFYNKIRK